MKKKERKNKKGSNLTMDKDGYNKCLETLASSHKSLKNVAKTHGYSFGQFWEKIHSTDKCTEQYDRAKKLQSELSVNDMYELVNSCKKTIEAPETDKQTMNALVNLCKIECDNIKWIACKLVPKFADKVTNELTTDSKGLKITFSVPKKKLSNNSAAATTCSGDKKEAEDNNV